MAEEITISVSIKQMDALVKALEHSGVNSGEWRIMMECYRDPELVKAAKSVRGLLKGRSQRASSRNVVSSSTDLTRALQKPDLVDELQRDKRVLIGELKEQMRRLRDVAGLLRQATERFESGDQQGGEVSVKDALFEASFTDDDLDDDILGILRR